MSNLYRVSFTVVSGIATLFLGLAGVYLYLFSREMYRTIPELVHAGIVPVGVALAPLPAIVFMGLVTYYAAARGERGKIAEERMLHGGEILGWVQAAYLFCLPIGLGVLEGVGHIAVTGAGFGAGAVAATVAMLCGALRKTGR